MGMFRDFAKAFREGMREADEERAYNSTKTYRLPADHEARVYTYDGRPLRGMPSNARFVIQAVPGRREMKSIYNGTVTSTDDFDSVAYSYNGKVFGMASSHASAVRKLMANGYRVEVEAYISGYNGDYGYPYVVGLFGFVDDDVYLRLR